MAVTLNACSPVAGVSRQRRRYRVDFHELDVTRGVHPTRVCIVTRVIREFVIRYLWPKKTHERIEKVGLGLLYLTTLRGGLCVCIVSAECVPHSLSQAKHVHVFRTVSPTPRRLKRIVNVNVAKCC